MTKTHSGTAVPVGAIARQNGWMHRFSAKLTCDVAVTTTGAGEVHCAQGAHSFRISPTLVRIRS